MFILAKSTIDPSNGDLFMQVFPQKFRSHKKAHAAMRKEYLKELEERAWKTTTRWTKTAIPTPVGISTMTKQKSTTTSTTPTASCFPLFCSQFTN